MQRVFGSISAMSVLVMRALPAQSSARPSKRSLEDALDPASKEGRMLGGYYLVRDLLRESFVNPTEAWYLDKPELKSWVDVIVGHFDFPDGLTPRSGETKDDWIERVARASAEYVNSKEEDFERLVRVVSAAPVNCCLPAEYLLANAMERCGITYSISMALGETIQATTAGIFVPDHRFDGSSVRGYRGRLGVGPERQLPPLVAAIGGIVYDFLVSGINLEVYQLLRGMWPFTLSAHDTTVMQEYTRVMNMLAAWDERNLLAMRIERAQALFEAIWAMDTMRISLTPYRTFQIITTRLERADLFMMGPKEYCDLALTDGRYGKCTGVINSGTYAVVCEWKTSLGQSFAVRFMRCKIQEMKRMHKVDIGVRDLVVHCSINPANVDGYGGAASNVVRLIDHQVLVTRPASFIADAKATDSEMGRLSQNAVWQVSVMEKFSIRSHEFLCENATGDNLRAFVAQIVAFLYQAGRDQEFTHHDLSIGNIGGTMVPSTVTYLHYSAANLWIPTAHSRGCLYKIYDFGMSRNEDVRDGDVDSDSALRRLETGYNPAADLLCLTVSLCNLVVFPRARQNRVMFRTDTVPLLEMLISFLPMDLLLVDSVDDEDELQEIKLASYVTGTETLAKEAKVDRTLGEILAALKVELTSVRDMLKRLATLYTAGRGEWPSEKELCNAAVDAHNVFHRSFYCWGPVTRAQRDSVQLARSGYLASVYGHVPADATPENTWTLQ